VADDVHVLAIDTASPLSAVALWSGGRVLEEALPVDRRASEELLPAIARCLERAGTPLSRVTRLAICAGPGSFTGLRVGLATAWALAKASGIPAETVSTLEAMAEAARGTGSRRAWAALDAGRGDVVFQSFDIAGVRAEPAGSLQRGAPDRAIEAAGRELLVALPAPLLRADGPRLPETPAAALARAAARAPRLGASADFEPIYGRPSAAEEKRGAA
jgi:tRNA threonylcarbamoyl adenosine modification protein YeaZ